MANPISDLQALARAPLEAARDLAVIAQALQTLPEVSAAVQPLPQAIHDIRNVPGIEDAAASVPDLLDAVHRVPTIERLLVSLIAALEPALADVRRVTEIVDAQQDQVTHIEAMVHRIERRSEVLERSVEDLQANADEAMRALSDPDDQDRGPLAKAAMSSPVGDSAEHAHARSPSNWVGVSSPAANRRVAATRRAAAAFPYGAWCARAPPKVAG